MYNVPLSMTGGTPISSCIYPQVLWLQYSIRSMPFSACPSAHASRLVDGRTRCSANSIVTIFRHWPIFLKGALKAHR